MSLFVCVHVCLCPCLFVSLFVCVHVCLLQSLFLSMFVIVGGPMKMNTPQVIFLQYRVLRNVLGTLKVLSCLDVQFALNIAALTNSHCLFYKAKTPANPG